MRSLLARLPWRGSLPFIITCAVVLLGLFVLKKQLGNPEKAEKRLQKLQEKARSEGGNAAPEAYVSVWLPKGVKTNLMLVGALLLASPWLGIRRSAEMKFMSKPETRPVGKWEILALVTLMGLAAWHNQPRLFQSMWGDEEFNASRFILDRVERQPDGTLKLTPREWTTTLWNMRKPTNHLGYSVFARLSHDAFFHKSTEPTAPWFSEALLRAPVFIAGLLLIPAFFWALRVWGLSAWWGLLLLLLHPWFTRFGVDGRGYGFIMLGATLMLGVLGRALQTGRWIWWVLFGLGNFFMIWSNLQGVYPAMALNLTAAACLFQLGLKNTSTWLLARRWFVANMLTLVIVVGWLAPCWPQLQEFMAKGEIRGTLDGRFWQDGLTAWFFGQPYQPWDEPENPYRYALQISMQTLPVLHLAGIGLFFVLTLAGIVALLQKPAHRALLLFSLGAPAVMLLHMYLGKNRPYDWYFCPFLPGLFLMAAAGAELLTKAAAAREGPAKAMVQAGLVMTVLLFAFITRQPRSLLRNHPIEPGRDAVASYRTVINPRNPDIDKDVMSGAFRMYTEGYDPAERRFDTVDELRKLMAESERSARRFYINVGFLRFLESQPSTKPICDILKDPTLFELHSVHYGLLHPTTRHVFRYKGKAP
ncbi:hypothetical protein DES53_101783 [Roseimicrobium gellanilyticum]|uniref:Dolichyl-phosphate-mannose-protein mannosyltransferase n=1 Tax=Roseimicrobium gellanilyticum TaxID=748857 RepID=A0A366HUL5_9BACT|nr:hypothetical protein [Roseimicrobium gellanilyticum]RBP47983.1 hypothetical protein DES53_101783 [Roseimicrobium gellanilyticum]